MYNNKESTFGIGLTLFIAIIIIVLIVGGGIANELAKVGV